MEHKNQISSSCSREDAAGVFASKGGQSSMVNMPVSTLLTLCKTHVEGERSPAECEGCSHMQARPYSLLPVQKMHTNAIKLRMLLALIITKV